VQANAEDKEHINMEDINRRRKKKINNNNLFFIIYMPSQQLQGQLQTQRSVDTSNYFTEKYNIKSKTNYRQALEKKHINTET
jgi:hypothetical protein